MLSQRIVAIKTLSFSRKNIDGAYWKTTIEAVTKEGFHLITRVRP